MFKLVTFSAALQAGTITPTSELTIPPYMEIDGSVFHDAEEHGTEQLSATQVLAQSSNLGTIEIAQRLGPTKIFDQMQRLGIGQPTGLGFPGESSGIVEPLGEWGPTDLASTAIGQNTAVTPMQVLDMMNSVAAGGVFVPPRIVQAVVQPDGSVRELSMPREHRVLSPEVTSELTAMLEQVVSDGTAPGAAVAGYTVAGKTGTAQIPNPKAPGYLAGGVHGDLHRVRPRSGSGAVSDSRVEQAHPHLRRDGCRTGVLAGDGLRPPALRDPAVRLPDRIRPDRIRPDRIRPDRIRPDRNGPRFFTRCTGGRDDGVAGRRCQAQILAALWVAPLLHLGRPVRSLSRPGKTPGARDRPVRGATTVRMDLLLEEVDVTRNVGDVASVEVTSIELDSRHAGPGALFCCLPGTSLDGHEFAADAVSRGAVAVLAERPVGVEVPQVIVEPGKRPKRDGACSCDARGTSRQVTRDHRRHGHQRKDDRHAPSRSDPRGSRPSDHRRGHP